MVRRDAGDLDKSVGELIQEGKVDIDYDTLSRPAEGLAVDIEGDAIANHAVANEVFNTAVNMGVAKAARFLQESLNLLNRNQRTYPDIVVDGWIGPTTIKTLKRLLLSDRTPKRLLRLLNVLQGMTYIEIVRRDPTQEKFIRGWLSRT